MGDAVIKVENVSKVYRLYDRRADRLIESLGLSRKHRSREHYALHDVSFEVNRGETVGLIGTNGSGKSTILKIITGVLNPTGGDVKINGRISALLELGAGFNMEYTGLENVYLNGTMIGFSREEIDTKLQSILDFADIGDFINQPVKTYSSGMFVRLAFAVAINIDPEILIVDEALSVGDVFFQMKCYHKFNEFKEAGKTILFVSHDLGSIAKYCDRVVLLNDGHKMAEGEPKQIIDLYKQVLVHQADEDSGLMQKIDMSHTAGDSGEQLWKEQLKLNRDALEYGSKEAEIVDFAVIDDANCITDNILKNTDFRIRMKVKFHEEVVEPVFAFTIKDLQGTEITGTNTMYEMADTGVINAGETRTIEFEQNMNLQGKDYMLSLGCTGFKAGNFVVYHRLYDVCSINVISEKDTVGFYDMNSKVRISQ